MGYSGSGVTPLSPLIEQVYAIAGESVLTAESYSAARLLAPIIGRDGRTGQFVRNNTRRGFSLKQAPKSGTSVSLYSDEFPQLTDAYTLGTYELELYKLAEHLLPDRVRNEWRNLSAVDQATRIGNWLGTLNAAAHSYLAFNYAGTSGNWDSDHAADGGDATSTSWDIISLLHTMRTVNVKAGKFAGKQASRLFIADDLYPYLYKNQYLRSTVTALQDGSGGIPYLTDDQVSNAIRAHLPGVEVIRVDTYYEAADGTVTADLSGKMIWTPVATNEEDMTLVTHVPNDESGNAAPFSIRNEYDKRVPGERFFCEFDGDIGFMDPKRGYLAHTLLS